MDENVSFPNLSELTSKEKEKLSKINSEIQERKEKEIAIKTKEEINKNKILDDHGIKASGRGWRIFCIISIIGFFALLLAIAGGAGYLMYTGKMNGIIMSTFSANITNSYSFNPSTTNSYDNKFSNSINNSYNIQFDMSDEWLDKICGMCNST